MSWNDDSTRCQYHVNLHFVMCKLTIDGSEIQVIHSILQLVPLGSMELCQSKPYRFYPSSYTNASTHKSGIRDNGRTFLLLHCTSELCNVHVTCNFNSSF